jgi:membrane protease YdiL (CAAX protease family)
VLLEEVAFRGALLAMLAARTTPPRALLGSAAAFGLWHVLPGWSIGTVNPTLTDWFGDAGRVVPVTAAVLSTAVAGVVLGLFRQRSGSLLAPMLVHWATNGLGYLVAYAVISGG